MKVIVEYLLNRPLPGFIQGIAIGVLMPLTLASLLDQKAGRLWPIVLAPLWLLLLIITIPVAIIYCLAMVTAKGPLWQYPPHQRGPAGGRDDAIAASERGAR